MMITQLTAEDALTATTAWHNAEPPHFRAHFNTVQGNDQCVHLGIFSDSSLRSVVTLVPKARGVYEVHLSAVKGAAVTELLPAFLSIRQQLFSELGVREISGWVPRLHWGVRKLAAQIGFVESGVSLLSVTNERLSEEVQVVLTNG